MSQHCVLCHQTLLSSERDTIPVGGKAQPVCHSCKRQYDLSSPEEQQRMLREAGLYSDTLSDEAVPPCPVCGAAMELKLPRLQIGVDGIGVIDALASRQYAVDLYACPQCGKVELYTAGSRPIGKG